jgi:hypothetical protein
LRWLRVAAAVVRVLAVQAVAERVATEEAALQAIRR